MKVLIIGGTGFIGEEILKLIRNQNIEIYAIKNKKNFQDQDNNINWIKCDIFNDMELKKVFQEVKPQYLLNLAWRISQNYWIANYNFDFLKTSISLLQYFKLNGGKRVVFAGTCAEYKYKSTPLKEGDLTESETTYAKCKNSLREIAEYYSLQNDVSFVWGRIFYAFGRNERETCLTSYLIKNLSKNKKVIINNGNAIRDYIYVKDVAGAFIKLLFSDVKGSVNVCSGKGIILKKYAKMIAQKLNKAQYLVFQENNEFSIIVGDNGRLLNEVGYKFRYDLSSALNDMIYK
ncbi:MAG: NAD(P)-dependent oxidoreductase [Lactobacillales bacterium]|jgi:nucleoside-diphosphate-sugar epimerase|nr:NAD(P)-dependent oxidoreductase [Lactobacillales bacterium]